MQRRARSNKARLSLDLVIYALNELSRVVFLISFADSTDRVAIPTTKLSLPARIEANSSIDTAQEILQLFLADCPYLMLEVPLKANRCCLWHARFWIKIPCDSLLRVIPSTSNIGSLPEIVA